MHFVNLQWSLSFFLTEFPSRNPAASYQFPIFLPRRSVAATTREHVGCSPGNWSQAHLKSDRTNLGAPLRNFDILPLSRVVCCEYSGGLYYHFPRTRCRYYLKHTAGPLGHVSTAQKPLLVTLTTKEKLQKLTRRVVRNSPHPAQPKETGEGSSYKVLTVEYAYICLRRRKVSFLQVKKYKRNFSPRNFMRHFRTKHLSESVNKPHILTIAYLSVSKKAKT